VKQNLLKKYAFDNLKATDIFAGHNPNNTNSKKILERLGFHYICDEYYAPTGLFILPININIVKLSVTIQLTRESRFVRTDVIE
jgi:hypothetical protein